MSIRLFDTGKAVGVVESNNNLDTWNGLNYNCGSTGHHLGIGKLKDGRYYVCHTTQWEGEQDYAEVISEEEAKELVLSRNPSVYEDIFNEPVPKLSI